MKYFLLPLICLLPFSYAFLQEKGDHIWLFGYDRFSSQPTHGSCFIDFNQLPPSIGRGLWGGDIDVTNASICNEEGNLVLYSNGNRIFNRQHELVAGGDGLNPNGTLGFNNGLNVIQGAIALQSPNEDNSYYLIHDGKFLVSEPDNLFITSNPLYYSKIDMGANNGLGKVTAKNQITVQDTLDLGKIVATRHANGRDWWAVVPQYGTNGFYRILVDPTGVHNMGVQEVGIPMWDGLGQACFSPDGTKYVHLSLKHFGVNYLNIYDFDRCTGELSNHVQYFFESVIGAGGVAISPNSRFLYLIEPDSIFQFDLWENDVLSSKIEVAKYDGYTDVIEYQNDTLAFPARFFLGQLAPDGKIYINSPYYPVRAMTTIDYPDKKGNASSVSQHSVILPTQNQYSMPHFPNYRLGPLDTSPCDTLGLDNLPIAKYRYEQDTTDYLQVEFTDLSYYEPATWHWDFGHGGAASAEANPVHVFPGPGSYEVCLTVANQYGQHSFCCSLSLGTVSSAEEARAVGVTLFPNPCREAVNVIISDYLPRSARVLLFDAVGRQVLSQAVTAGWNTVRLEGLAAGVYFYQVREACAGCPGGEVLLDGGKVVRVE